MINLASSDTLLISKVIEIRQQFRLKLPDALRAAMAINNSAILVTAERAFAKITVLTVMNW